MRPSLSGEGAVCRETLAVLDGAADPPYEEHLAWELTRCAPSLDSADVPRVHAFVAALLTTARNGSTRIAIRDGGWGPSELVQRVLALQPEDPLFAIFGTPGESKPFIVSFGGVGTHRSHAAEAAIADGVTSRLSSCSTPAETSRPIPGGAGLLGRLSPTQRAAVQAALSLPILLVTGGPGTGKTSIVAALLEELARAGTLASDIALGAPTGKAAFRLTESLGGVRAETLHRLLGYSPRTRTFARGAAFPIDARVVILDEASMIDAELMHRLVVALRPDARLILLGDADQLPSVAPGAPFRDLVSALAPPFSVRLTESHRMNQASPEGGAILEFASEVREGRGLPERGRASSHVVVRQTVDELRFSGVELLLSPFRTLDRPLLAAWLRRVFLGRELGHAERGMLTRPHDPPFDEGAVGDIASVWKRAHSQRILSVTREPSMATSVTRVNQAIRAIREEAGRHRGVAESFVPGDPIVFTRNDYRLDLFNGDEGVVLASAVRPSVLHVVFRRDKSFVSHPLAAVAHDIELSYATTVHRAQGGEFDDVLLLLPERDTELATRELVYTAITRARRSVVVVGEAALFERAVGRTLQRATWLLPMLLNSFRDKD